MSERLAQGILSYLAALAPVGRRATDVVSRESEFAWLGGNPNYRYVPDVDAAIRLPKTDQLKRLVGIDSLSPTEDLLRLGWLFLTGTIEVDQESVRYCLPLLSVPVKIRSFLTWYQLSYAGAMEMPDDLFDWNTRLELETSTHAYGEGSSTGDDEVATRFPRLAEWVKRALDATGLPQPTLRGGNTNPLKLRSQPGLSVVAGSAIYTSRDVLTPNSAGVLSTWAHKPVAETALWALYRADRAPEPANDPAGVVSSPLPLNRAQREGLERTRREPITVVSGPPGTGKSHLVAAVAIDQVAQGRSVLVATQSHYAASVIAELLDRYPGPRFVRFGNRDDRESVAAELGDGLAQPLSARKQADLRAIVDSSAKELARINGWIARLLEREVAFTNGLCRRDLARLAAVETPGVLDEGFDLDMAEGLLQRAREGIPILRAWAKARAGTKLRHLVRCDAGMTLDDIDAGMDAARAERDVRRGMAEGGLSLGDAWSAFERADTEHREMVGRLIEAERRSRENSQHRSTRAVATLASALRAGRARRRQLLQELQAEDFLDVLPLWLGTLTEIDDTLPVIPGAFDLVIFDEASQIDQMRAAPALARAKRALIVGDPRQLRHVSFVSDDSMRQAADAAHLDPALARLLDVRRNSLFDIGASASQVTWLDEHFRSAPHIIEFSDHTFYGGNLRLMTQHPRNESKDAIETVRIAGTRDRKGVNLAEVDEVMRQISPLRRCGISVYWRGQSIPSPGRCDRGVNPGGVRARRHRTTRATRRNRPCFPGQRT